MTWAFIVLSDFTTRSSGKACWICSARESVLATVSDGGNPREKSRGFARSIRILPLRFSFPASLSACSEPVPAVQLKRIGPNAAASAKVPCEARSPAPWVH
jgi:hypothetical protein